MQEEQVPQGTLKQMAAYVAALDVIYPDRRISAALLYTQTPQLIALPAEILEALSAPHLTTGAVCVYHDMIPAAVRALDGSGIPVAAVSTGFPDALSPFHLRVQEIEESVKAGASEIDIVISRRHVLTGDWQALYDEMRAYREACGEAHVKAIISTGNSSIRPAIRSAICSFSTR